MNSRLIFALTAFCAALCSFGAAGSKSYADYLKERRRVISRAVVSNMVITVFAQGTKTWAETNEVKRVVVRTAPVRYSKLKLITAAKAAGKWDDVKAAITAMDLEDEWQACQYVTSDYPAYIAATNTVVTQGIATDAEVQAFMRQAEDN